MIDDLTALRLQLDWGVDETLGDDPVDRFGRAPPLAREIPTARLPSERHAEASSPPDALAGIDSLAALHEALDRSAICPLRATATHTVRPAGAANASIVLIADAPGNDDDRSGLAFSGPAGAMLDRVMGSIGLTRDDMLLTTLVPWRPPGNRPPSGSEIQACLPYLQRLLMLIRPRIVLLAGSGPVGALTGQLGTIRQLRGKWLEIPLADEQIKLAALPILPFAQWLRDPGSKQQLWSDLMLLRRAATTA